MRTPIMQDHPHLSKKLVYLMAASAGIGVANLYYGQPLLPSIANEFHLNVRTAGAMATTTQVGYGLGMLFLVPLGDSFERRKLIVAMLGAVTAVLVLLTFAPSVSLLFAAWLMLGLTTVTPQLILPFAAHLADPAERGRVVGFVMSGLLVGVLLARTFSGILGAQFGWRAVYGISAGIMLSLAVVMWRALPAIPPSRRDLSYGALLRSLIDLVREEPVLIESALFGSLSFASFSAFWTVLPFFLAQPPYGYGSDRVGLFGLIGLSGILAAPISGRWSDQGHGRTAVAGALALMMLSYLVLWQFGLSLLGLTLGFVFLDFGATVNHITNQARVYGLQPEARSRINTVYMTTYFTGGAFGSFAGAWAWNNAGWAGLSAAGALFPALGLLLFAAFRNKRARQAATLPVQSNA